MSEERLRGALGRNVLAGASENNVLQCGHVHGQTLLAAVAGQPVKYVLAGPAAVSTETSAVSFFSGIDPSVLGRTRKTMLAALRTLAPDVVLRTRWARFAIRAMGNTEMWKSRANWIRKQVQVAC